MKCLLSIAVALCFVTAAAAQKTSIAPSPTPAQSGTPAPPQPAVSPASPAGPASSAARPAQSGSRNPAPPTPSTTPVANSSMQITGNPQLPGNPSDDKPLLPIVTVPNALGLRSGTPIRVHLAQTADSGHLRNGDTVTASLTAPLAGLPVGTPVTLTVVMASRAGAMVSYGELSLQVTSIANRSVLSDIVTALGKEGKKELADSAPATGTEAEFAANQDFTFPAA